GAAGAAAVLDHDLAPERRAHLARDDAGDHVVAAARRIRNHQHDGTGRKLLGTGCDGARHPAAQGEGDPDRRSRRHGLSLHDFAVARNWRSVMLAQSEPRPLGCGGLENDSWNSASSITSTATTGRSPTTTRRACG